MFRLIIVSLLTVLSSSANAEEVFFAKIEVGASGDKTLLDLGQTHRNLAGLSVEKIVYPQVVVEHQPLGSQYIMELYATSEPELHKVLRQEGIDPVLPPSLEEDPTDEVITLVDSGPSSNRIDLVFMGDGYTVSQRDLFIADMERLVHEMFVGATFKTQLPLFNIHLVFRPSAESGIGRGSPKNTAYRLYREGNTLRAIYMGNSSAARSSCRAAPGCDYPIVIANDPYYGGLGGEFAISTSSVTSGTVVLRHELGHTVGRVGEEYDGGGYFGANHTNSSSNPSWRHWLSAEQAAVEPVSAKHIAWPWRYLPDRSYELTWESSANMSGYQITLSASGIESSDAIDIRLDGERIDLEVPGHLDRDFHEILKQDGGFGQGRHEMVISNGSTPGDHWLSSIHIFEFGHGFNYDNSNVSLYPVFTSVSRRSGYRPTFEGCLMRNMEYEYFCVVCQENNWLQFLSRIDLIDDVKVEQQGTTTSIILETPRLAQLRPNGVIGNEILQVRWSRDGVSLPEFNDMSEIEVLSADSSGSWKVEVEYKTEEVRYDPRGYMKSSKNFSI